MMLVVDFFGSMCIDDMCLVGCLVSCFGVVEVIVSDFIVCCSGDELGLVLFGSCVFLVMLFIYDFFVVFV